MLQVLFRCFRIITKITTGAPKTAVTVLMLNSVGAKTVRASQSLNRQNTLPPRKQPGISTSGLENISYTSDTGKNYDFNTADVLNTLLLNCMFASDRKSVV